MLLKLKDSRLGYHVGCTFSGAFGYADDLDLVSQSHSELHQIIQICVQYTMEYSIVKTIHILNYLLPLSVYEISVCNTVRELCQLRDNLYSCDIYIEDMTDITAMLK